MTEREREREGKLGKPENSHTQVYPCSGGPAVPAILAPVLHSQVQRGKNLRHKHTHTHDNTAKSRKREREKEREVKVTGSKS